MARPAATLLSDRAYEDIYAYWLKHPTFDVTRIAHRRKVDPLHVHIAIIRAQLARERAKLVVVA